MQLFYFPLKKKQTFTCYIEIKMYTATLPVHIKLRIKRKAVPSCLLPRLPLRVLPRPLLHSGFYCRDSNESFQRGSRDSLGCQMSDVSGLHAEVFFRD